MRKELSRRAGYRQRAKAELKRVLAERYEAGLAAIDDPDLTDQ